MEAGKLASRMEIASSVAGFRMGGYQVEYVFDESATDILSHQIASAGITAADNPDVSRVFEFPDAVIPESPEGVFAVIVFSTGAEIHEELFEFFVNFSVGDKSVTVSKTAGQGYVQQKQGFMGSALGAALPDGDVFD